MASRVQLRRDTSANWISAGVILAQGEMAIETDTLKLKIGNGIDDWANLGYAVTGIATHGISLNDSASPIASGFKGFYRVPFDCRIVDWSIVGNIAGTATFDIWRAHNAQPTVADTLISNPANKPTITNEVFTSSTDLTNWDTDLLAGDILGYNLDNSAIFRQLQLIINVINN